MSPWCATVIQTGNNFRYLHSNLSPNCKHRGYLWVSSSTRVFKFDSRAHFGLKFESQYATRDSNLSTNEDAHTIRDSNLSTSEDAHRVRDSNLSLLYHYWLNSKWHSCRLLWQVVKFAVYSLKDLHIFFAQVTVSQKFRPEWLWDSRIASTSVSNLST